MIFLELKNKSLLHYKCHHIIKPGIQVLLYDWKYRCCYMIENTGVVIWLKIQVLLYDWKYRCCYMIENAGVVTCIWLCVSLCTLSPRSIWYTKNCTWSSLRVCVLIMLFRSAPIKGDTRYLQTEKIYILHRKTNSNIS